MEGWQITVTMGLEEGRGGGRRVEVMKSLESVGGVSEGTEGGLDGLEDRGTHSDGCPTLVTPATYHHLGSAHPPAQPLPNTSTLT